MKSKPLQIELSLFLLCAATPCARPQGTFANLGFESANIQPGTPPGEILAASSALPGWTCYLGTNQVTAVHYDTLPLNDAEITIHDANSSYVPVLEGSYTVYLQPNFPAYTILPAIAQVGTIPTTARSLQFYGGYFPTVFFGGQQLGLATLATTPTYSIFAADVTAFAGQTGELRFSGTALLDNIAFSSQAIPEPGAVPLLMLAAALAAPRLLSRLRRRHAAKASVYQR